MKKYFIHFLAISALIFSGCNDVLDRPEKTKPTDDNYWKTETDLRLYTNHYFPQYFVGYNSGWSSQYTPLRGYNFADDFASVGKQTNFENSIPSSRGSEALSTEWLTQYVGPNWNFAWIKKSNIFIDRIENRMKNLISEEAYNHWLGVAKFFRGFEYHRLTSVFGDIPLYTKPFDNSNYQEMWKDRAPRNEVMAQAYEDFKYAFDNIRLDDGEPSVNKYIAAAFISRIMLFEGTWVKYHQGDNELAKKYLSFAQEASEFIMNSGKYEISGDYKSLFGSFDLKGHKEVILYRHYDASKGVTHHIASYSNAYEAQVSAPNLALAQSFICNDGKPYLNSSVADANKLDIKNMIKTRDPRFESTFIDHPKVQSATLLYASKFIDRVGPTYWNSGNIPPQYGGVSNDNDYPVLRYAEVLLNWIEIKAELATIGGPAITQADIDKSINLIRNRDLDEIAINKGVQKTAPMKLSEINDAFDPNRDPEVSPLLWEIRRERRMEFVFEYSRLLDIKRWKKLDYMNNEKYPNTMLGLWINVPEELPEILEDKEGKPRAVQVVNEDGVKITYDGTNRDKMIGFYVPENAKARDSFTDRSYLSPIGQAQIEQYADKGSKLTQTQGW